MRPIAEPTITDWKTGVGAAKLAFAVVVPIARFCELMRFFQMANARLLIFNCQAIFWAFDPFCFEPPTIILNQSHRSRHPRW